MLITWQMRGEIQTTFLPQEESCRSPRVFFPGLWFADLECGAKGTWWEMQINRRMVALPQILTQGPQQNQKTANARHCSYFFTYYSALQKVPTHAYKLMCTLLLPLAVSMFYFVIDCDGDSSTFCLELLWLPLVLNFQNIFPWNVCEKWLWDFDWYFIKSWES